MSFLSKFRPIGAILLFIISFYSHAQIIKGQIRDIKGSPIIGASVFIDGSSQGTSSDSKGEFELKIGALSQNLRISSIGFQSVAIPVADFRDGNKMAIQLKEDLYQLPEIIVERNTLTGGLANVGSVPGSAHYLSMKQLNKFSYTDANRVLRNVPGINIQEEDGFGLRPNIGMRGTGVERSSKITLMEDGILMAPAPYTAPSAYYFPSMGRMQGVEVRKGSSQIKYGPYTTGGAINLISTAIPTDFSSRLSLFGGNYGRRTVHAMVGQSFEYGGVHVGNISKQCLGI